MAKGKKPKKEVVKAEWRRLPEVEALVEEIVLKFHKGLERAKIAVLGKPTAGKRMGKRVITTVHRPTAAMNALHSEEQGEIHYWIGVGMDAWGELDQKAKRRELDRALSHFIGLNEKGVWQIIGPDVQEFTDILRRYGPYNAELEMFVEAARQLDLPFQE